MRVLSLFSGGGLGDYGLELAGMEIVGQVEIDDYCQKILKLRWPDVPKWRDIREVKGADLPACDLISGGFPCQPFSVAGKRRGKEDDRNLWHEMYRIITTTRPAWVLAENVGGSIPMVVEKVCSDLEALRYETLPLYLPAFPFGVDHKRYRIWIVANDHGQRREGGREKPLQRITKLPWSEDERRIEINRIRRHIPAPVFRRASDGPPYWVERLKLLGNGQVVQVVEWIGKQIMAFEASRPDERGG